jgi:aldehyde dehydrogenase
VCCYLLYNKIKLYRPISVVENEMESIKLANDSKFGLEASLWTEDLDKAERLSRMIQSGIVTVNNVVVSDPRIPFGGIKNSSFGRSSQDMGCLNLSISSQSV